MSKSKVVGILSMQQVLNYGSFLQAYALKQLLLQSGTDEVHFIDINPGYILRGFESATKFGRALRAIKLCLTGRLPSKIRELKFDNKMRASIARNLSTLGLDEQSPKEFDVAVIGSDEVFNCCQVSSWGYTTQLYGNIPEAKKVISYAGSFGHTTYEQLVDLGIDQEIGDTLKTMSAISVRDQNSYEIVEKTAGIKPEIHLDPVLIYGYEKEIKQRTVAYSEKYMIVYSYQGRINDRDEINEIVSFASTKRLKLISIFCRYDWCDEAVIPDTPFDVLAWFKSAEYIVTDTFHGTIFSVITHRPFFSLVRSSNRQKLGYLLEKLGLRERGNNSLSSEMELHIDYNLVEEVLKQERERTRGYLRSMI